MEPRPHEHLLDPQRFQRFLHSMVSGESFWVVSDSFNEAYPVLVTKKTQNKRLITTENSTVGGRKPLYWLELPGGHYTRQSL